MAKRATGSAVRCLFCGRSAPEVKMTRQHVLPRWLRHHAEMAGMTSHQQLFKDAAGTVTAHRDVPQPPWEMQIRDVCGICNSGWLATEVEEPVGPLMRELMRGVPLILSEQDSVRLATWAVMASIVRDAMHQGSPTTAEQDRRSLMDARALPEWSSVWLADSGAPLDVVFTHHERWEAYPQLDEGDGEVQLSYATTFALGRLALHVLYASGADAAAMMYGLPLWPEELANGLVALWPAPEPIAWPGAVPLDAERLARLARWVPQHLGQLPPPGA